MKLFDKDLVAKLVDAHNSETSENPAIVAKVRNVYGPGSFYLIDGFIDEENNKTLVVRGITDIDFSGEKSFLDEPVETTLFAEDFETFNIPYGRVHFDIDNIFSGKLEDAIKALKHE